MVVVSETKESQLLALLEQCVHLDADVRPRRERNGQSNIRMWCVTALTVTVHWFMCCKRMWQRHGMGIGLFRAFFMKRRKGDHYGIFFRNGAE